MKTLGQIAHDAGKFDRQWHHMGESQKAEWERIAQAVIDAQQVAVPKVTVELPDGDERTVKTWFTEMRDGELWVAISVEAQQVAVPPGWVPAPIEPTLKMIRAGAEAARKYMERTDGNSPSVIYRAMLAAAPQPPQGDSNARKVD